MFFTKRKRSVRHFDLSPDEIFVDASNLPAYDEQQFEGRIERAIGRRTFFSVAIFCFLIFLIFFGRTFWLSVVKGDYYAKRSQNNSLSFTPIFAERGNIYDRNGKELAWTGQVFATGTLAIATSSKSRIYINEEGFGHLLGYVSYPNQEEASTGKYNPKEYLGRSGVEKEANDLLLGARGVKIVEINAQGVQESDYITKNPIPGKELKLSIDSLVQAKLYEYVKQLAVDRGFVAGAGVIMDVKTGEMLAMVNYPDYDSNIISQGKDHETIDRYFTSKKNIMLNRAVGGLYTPGSVFKPFMALGALNEKIVNPNKNFVTNGELVVVNPYNKKEKTIFKDWKDQGVVDMRRAIEMSSNVYFYIIGGGYGGQKGLGITNINKYAKIFGLSLPTGINLPGEEEGILPNPEWKAKTFKGEPWRLGDTYHTAIGQYGVLVTPIQMVRAYSAIANKGYLINPTIFKLSSTTPIIKTKILIDQSNFQVVHEGMKACALTGTAKALNLPGVSVSAKTGTAELGETKEKVNSWVSGFWPSENPRFAFVVVMEKGSRSNLVGGAFVMRQLLDWMRLNTPEYLSG